MNVAIIYSHPSHQALINAFRELNCVVYPYFYGIHINTLFQKGYYKLLNKQKIIINRFNKQIQECVKKNDFFDLIVVFKGHKLSENSKYLLNNNLKPIVQWTTDSIERNPDQKEILRFSHKTFFQDGNDVKLHKHGEWLPLGYDCSFFSYTENKEIDILLLGNLSLPHYKTRLEYINEVAKLGKQGFNVIFAGSNASEKLKKHFRKNNVKYLGRLPFKEYAEVIKKSKVCVNVHQDDGGKAINPLFFAIPAVGGIQVTDIRDYYNEWLQEGKTFFPFELNLLNDNIVQLLNNWQGIEFKISEEIKKLHSYKARALKILSSI